MSVSNLSKIDFFIFSPANGGSSSLYVQVPIDYQLLQSQFFPKVLSYFQNIMLSEIMTKNWILTLKIAENFIVTVKALALDK